MNTSPLIEEVDESGNFLMTEINPDETEDEKTLREEMNISGTLTFIDLEKEIIHVYEWTGSTSTGSTSTGSTSTKTDEFYKLSFFCASFFSKKNTYEKIDSIRLDQEIHKQILNESMVLKCERPHWKDVYAILALDSHSLAMTYRLLFQRRFKKFYIELQEKGIL
jgi:hypothetical protein